MRVLDELGVGVGSSGAGVHEASSTKSGSARRMLQAYARSLNARSTRSFAKRRSRETLIAE
jgi:hypothetical protein